MLRVTADIFSGRPNPTWVMVDDKEVRAVLKEVSRSRDLITDAAPAEAGLGFRGVMVEPLADDLALDFELAASVYIPVGAGGVAGRGSELAERLLSFIPKAELPSDAGPDALPLDEQLQSFLMEQFERSLRASALDAARPEPAHKAPKDLTDAICYYDLTPYNPGFWNNDSNVRLHNNCYHYASNKRRNSFHVQPGGGQPGAGCGHMYTALTCAEVTRAALCDGLHRRYDCFPDSEYPRHLVALVIWPNYDFHWYRKQKEGFWGHKPGSTAVRNVDNSNKVILDPATCDRDGYTEFCGYFYTCRSQKIV